jgi:hypothetical protein
MRIFKGERGTLAAFDVIILPLQRKLCARPLLTALSIIAAFSSWRAKTQ